MGVGSPWSGGRSGEAPKLFSSLPKASGTRGLSPGMYPLATSDAPEGERERVLDLLSCLGGLGVGDAGAGEMALESLSSFLPLHLLVYFCFR